MRLVALSSETAGLPVVTIGQRILESVDRVIGEAAASDDISLVVLRRTGNG